jgi:hypothetical protein
LGGFRFETSVAYDGSSTLDYAHYNLMHVHPPHAQHW